MVRPGIGDEINGQSLVRGSRLIKMMVIFVVKKGQSHSVYMHYVSLISGRRTLYFVYIFFFPFGIQCAMCEI